jgi:putative membrane protein
VMGIAEVLPGFSGGTVAFVAGIYARMIANIRQGARVLSLLLRGRVPAAVAGLRALEWPFLLALFVPMLVAIFTTAGWLRDTVESRPVEVSAVLLGLALGATVVAARQLREPAAWHWLVTLAAAAGFFWLLGYSPGTIEDPSLLLLALGGAVAVCAWVLPGVSGSFLLLVLGLWVPVLDAIADRDVLGLLALLIGMTSGIAAFSTLLNWLLSRAHDAVLAVMLGLLLGSARILWPWPSDAGVGGSAELGAPVGSEAFLAAALALGAFGLVWMFGLLATAVERRRRVWLEARTPADGGAGTVG